MPAQLGKPRLLGPQLKESGPAWDKESDGTALLKEGYAMTAHAPGPEGIFGTRALCGADVTVSPVLTLTQISDDVDCLVCADMLRATGPIVVTRPSMVLAAIVVMLGLLLGAVLLAAVWMTGARA